MEYSGRNATIAPFVVVGINSTIATTWETQRNLALVAVSPRLRTFTQSWRPSSERFISSSADMNFLFLWWSRTSWKMAVIAWRRLYYKLAFLELSHRGVIIHLRAEDGQAKCSCRQGTQSIVAVVGIIACVSRSTKTVETSTGSGQDCDDNKSTNEQ
jgi:hypothetical protein